MDKDGLINGIEKAFSNAKLGDGIGLWEAQAIDDYESEEVQKHEQSGTDHGFFGCGNFRGGVSVVCPRLFCLGKSNELYAG